MRLVGIAKGIDDFSLALKYPPQIDADVAGEHTIIGRTPREVSHAPAGHHGLRRSAPLIDASPADMFPLDEDGAHPRLRQRSRERRARLPRTDDDGIVLLRSVHNRAHDCTTRECTTC